MTARALDSAIPGLLSSGPQSRLPIISHTASAGRLFRRADFGLMRGSMPELELNGGKFHYHADDF